MKMKTGYSVTVHQHSVYNSMLTSEKSIYESYRFKNHAQDNFPTSNDTPSWSVDLRTLSAGPITYIKPEVVASFYGGNQLSEAVDSGEVKVRGHRQYLSTVKKSILNKKRRRSAHACKNHRCVVSSYLFSLVESKNSHPNSNCCPLDWLAGLKNVTVRRIPPTG